MTTPDSVIFTWRGITMGGGGARIGVRGFAGLIGVPGGSPRGGKSPSGHGVNPSPIQQDPRTVVLRGIFRPKDITRNDLIAVLTEQWAPLGPDDPTLLDLGFSAAGRTGKLSAQLLGWDVPTDAPRDWAAGYLPLNVTWFCPDPRVRGEAITATALLITATTGAPMPGTMPMQMPAQPIGGQVTISNPGSSAQGSATRIVLNGGGQAGSVGVERAGVRLVYPVVLVPGDELVIDSEQGAFLNGQYRPALNASVGVTQDLRARPGVNVFRATGTAGAGAPRITVTVEPQGW